VSDFRHAIFFFESDAVPPELRVVDGVISAFAQRPEANTTLVLKAQSCDEAAPVLDDFKGRTCGSPVTLAVVNLNMFPSFADMEFLMRPNVLGDPRTIFLASLKYMAGDIYGFARDKVAHESQTVERTPSCIDCYGAPNRDNVFPRTAELIGAYIHEAEAREAAYQNRGTQGLEPAAAQLLRKSETTFFGKGASSGRFRPVDSSSASGMRKSHP
jgi:hypothetical protein